MSDDQVQLQMSLPLDSDGFLRRECPTCEREFKALVDPDAEEDVAPAVETYYCPYCGVDAPGGAWATRAQVDLAESIIYSEVVGPGFNELADEFKTMSAKYGGIVQARVEYDEPEEPDPLTEVDDMRRVEFTCHPTQPIKVLDDWSEPVRCLICGAVPA